MNAQVKASRRKVLLGATTIAARIWSIILSAAAPS
jgi:hypothetical protein